MSEEEVDWGILAQERPETTTSIDGGVLNPSKASYPDTAIEKARRK